MAAPEYNKGSFYATFNETDLILEDEESWNPLLEELFIAPEDFMKIAVGRVNSLVNCLNAGLSQRLLTVLPTDEKRDEKGDITIFLAFKPSSEELASLALIWGDGFVTHLRFKEQVGLTWDEINEDAIKAASKDSLNQGLLAAMRAAIRPWLKEIVTFRVKSLFATLNGKKSPVPGGISYLSKREKELLPLGQILFMDAFMVAGVIPTRPQNDEALRG